MDYYLVELVSGLCEKLSLPNGNVSRAVKNGYKVGDYKFERLTDKTINHQVIGKCKDSGEIRYQFDSVRAAGRALSRGISAGGCTKSLKSNGKNSWKGCYWYYITTPSI